MPRYKAYLFSPEYSIIHRDTVEAPDIDLATEIFKKSFEQKFGPDKNSTVSIKELP